MAQEQIDLSYQVTGTLASTNGGTAQSSWTKGDLLCSTAANTLSKLAIGSNATILTADSSSACGLKWSPAPIVPLTKAAVFGQPLLSYDSTTGLFTQGQLSCNSLSDSGLFCSAAGQPPANTPLVAKSFLTYFDSTSGVFGQRQPACTDLSDNGSLCTSSGPLATTLTSATHKWLASYDSTTGLFTQTQPAYSDISGTPTLPANTTSTTHQYFTAYNSSTGAFTKAQPVCADLSDAGTFCTTSSIASTDLSDTSNVARYNATTAFTAAQTIIKAGIAGTPTNGLLLENTTASTSLATKQLAPNLYWQGHVWNTTATAADNCDEWEIFPNTTSGATPTSVLSIRGVLGASCGGAFTEWGNIGSTGMSIKLGNTYQINGTQISATALSNGTTGTAGTNVVLATSPTITTPSFTTGFKIGGAAASGKYPKGDGTNFVTSTGSAAGTGSCTNQAVTAENADAAPTCTTLTSSYVDTSIAKVIASGTSTFTTTAAASGACQTTVTTAATGALTSDTIAWAYTTAPVAATDGRMELLPYVTANNVNFMRCNNTAASVTPTALVVNWRVIR